MATFTANIIPIDFKLCHKKMTLNQEEDLEHSIVAKTALWPHFALLWFY